MGPKPTSTKSPRVSKPETGKLVRNSKSDNKPECKPDSKSENSETKKLGKDEEDTSVLHPSVDLSGSGLRQISQIFEKGTSEIQNLLSFECDVIYECKICRNLFRSVANFISHKRIYCTTPYQTSNQLLNMNNKLEEDCDLLDPADAVHPNSVKTKLKNPNRIVPRSNLAAVLSSCVSFPKPVHIRSDRNDFMSNWDNSLLLQSMQGSKAGVFQTYIPNSSSGHPISMEKQMQELYSAQQEKTKIIQQNFWEVNRDKNFEFTNGVSDSESNKNFSCDRCGLTCTSAKTLLRHMKLVHETARTCYLCPCCKSTFPNTWSIHRHLFKVHHKTNEQVRKLRLQIKSKVLKPGEVMKGLTDKIKIVNQKVTDQQRWDLENEEWLDQLGKDVDLLRCGSCGRKFERRAALKAHYQICQKRVVPVTSTIQYRATPETENPPEKAKSIANNLKLLPVVALTALTPAQIKEKSTAPEKKIGIQVRMDYCKNMTSSTNSERSNRLSGFDKRNPRDIINLDDERAIEKPKSCLETLLTQKRNNRSDSGNDSESQDDISVALDFSSDSVIDEDTIRLNMYDILGISSTDSNIDSAFPSSVNMESSNCDEFINENIVPNKRKKAFPVKRLVCNVENGLKTDINSHSEVWSEKSNDLDCVFRKENVKVTYTNCKKSNKTELDKINHPNDPPDSICPELVEKLANFYNKTNGICLLCNNKFDPVNILRHITEHGNWLKFRCKWPQCEHETSTKTELTKHISEEHQRLKTEEIVPHNFVELISKKDWKFIVAISANKYRKKPNLLLQSVNKLKERLNGVGKLTALAIREPNDSNNSVKSNENCKASICDKEPDFDQMNGKSNTKAVEAMDFESVSSTEIEIVDLNSSIDDKDYEVLSIRSNSQNDLFDTENSSHLVKPNCDVVDEDDVDIVNDNVGIVSEDNANIINKGDVNIVKKGESDIIIKDYVSQISDIKTVAKVACGGNKALLESNLEVTTESNEKILCPKILTDLSDEKSSSNRSSNLNEEIAFLKSFTGFTEKNASIEVSLDLNEKITFPGVSTDLNEEKKTSIVSTDTNEASLILPNTNEKEAFCSVSTNLNKMNATPIMSIQPNEEKTSPELLKDSKRSSRVLTKLNKGGAIFEVSTDMNEENAPPKVLAYLSEIQTSAEVLTYSNEKEVSMDLNNDQASPKSRDSNEKETCFEVSTNLNEKEVSVEVSTILNESEECLKERTVSTEPNEEDTSCKVSRDLSENFLPSNISTDLVKQTTLCEVPTDSNEGNHLPKKSSDLNENNAPLEVSTASNKEKLSIESSTISNEEAVSQKMEAVLTNSSEESSLGSSNDRMSCDSPLVLDEDNFINDSQCVDTTDVDPTCSLFDQSEMEVELDDDHLRAVMMEVIFGGTSNETASSSTGEFVSKNADGTKKRKLIDPKLNV